MSWKSTCAPDTNASVAANVGAPGSVHHASSRRHTRVVQQGGRTEVYESEESKTEGRA